MPSPISSPSIDRRLRLERIYRSVVVLLALAVLSAAGVASTAAARENVDRIIAVVDGQLITHSDLLTYSELIERTRDSLLPTMPLIYGPPETALERTFPEAVLRTLVYRQAEKLNLVEIDEEEFEKRWKAFKDTFASAEQFDRFNFLIGLREEQTKFLVRQFVVCEAFILKKIGLQVRIGLRPYYEAHKDEFAGASFQEASPQIEQILYNEKLDTWFRELTSRADIRVVEDSFKEYLR